MTKKRTTTTTHAIGGKQGAACGELMAILSKYVDGEMGASACKELEAHLAKCNPCRVVVDNVRKTITLYRDSEPCKLPAKFRSRLHSALKHCWKSTGPRKKRAKNS